jgi:hypothetical protein
MHEIQIDLFVARGGPAEYLCRAVKAGDEQRIQNALLVIAVLATDWCASSQFNRVHARHLRIPDLAEAMRELPEDVLEVVRRAPSPELGRVYALEASTILAGAMGVDFEHYKRAMGMHVGPPVSEEIDRMIKSQLAVGRQLFRCALDEYAPEGVLGLTASKAH